MPRPAAAATPDTDAGGDAPATLGQAYPHRVWLAVWWPDVPADVEPATSAPLPGELPAAVFGAIPENLRPAVAYALLREQVASFSEARRCREAVGFELPGGAWAIGMPVTVGQEVGGCDLVAVFTIDVDDDDLPTGYTFSSWVSPADAGELIRATHRRAPSWGELDLDEGQPGG